MPNGEDTHPLPATKHYWTVLPKFIYALDRATDLTRAIGGIPTQSAQQYWASVLFVRLCSEAISVLHLCPGSPPNKAGAHWDFSSLAPLVRSLVKTGLLLFYLGTEVVGEDESRARLLVMNLRDSKERMRMFQNFGAGEEKVRRYEAKAKHICAELVLNPYFVRLPVEMRNTIAEGESATILTDDQILDRMEILDQPARAFLRLISSHAEVSPLAYYLTGEGDRGRGEENDGDIIYTATALDLACDFVLRADADMRTLFRKVLGATPERTAAPNERFERALDYVLQWEGNDIGELASGDDSRAPLLCSECFSDEGLRLDAARIGQRDMSKCTNCGSQRGFKLSKPYVAALAQQFFVSGTMQVSEYGAAPTVELNKRQATSIAVAPWLEPDLRLIERTLQVGFFHYGPQLWMLGEVAPLKALRKSSTRAAVVTRILNEYPGRILYTDECFYRLRTAPATPGDFREYDSPPSEKLGKGRFDTAELPILYGSQDLEVCVHECRVTADDELYVATLAPSRGLKLLNLAEPLWEEHVTEFESLDIALHMLFLARRHSYEISRDIASAAQKYGFDGLVYPSYFTLLRTGAARMEKTYGISLRMFPEFREHIRKNTISNLALFGRPLADGLIKVRCINRVMLKKVDYTLHFGPIIMDESMMTTAANQNPFAKTKPRWSRWK